MKNKWKINLWQWNVTQILPARQIGGVAEAVEYTVELDFFLLMTRLNELIGRCVSRNPPKYENLKRYQFLMLQWLNEMKECQWFIPLTARFWVCFDRLTPTRCLSVCRARLGAPVARVTQPKGAFTNYVDKTRQGR